MPEIKISLDEMHSNIQKYIPDGYKPTRQDIEFVSNWNKYITDKMRENISLDIVEAILNVFTTQIHDIKENHFILIPWDDERCIIPETFAIKSTCDDIRKNMKSPNHLSIELGSVLQYAVNSYMYEFLDYQLLTGLATNLVTINVVLRDIGKWKYNGI